MSATQLPTNQIQNPYKFSAYRAADSTLAAGADTKIICDTELYDTGSNYNTTNGRFTAPVAGFYQFTGVVHVGASASPHNVQFRKNGSLVSIAQELPSISGTIGMAGTVEFQLAASDYIELFAYNGSGGAKTYMGGIFRTQFSGHLISRT